MRLRSTRDASITASFKDAILTGLAPDGGLYAIAENARRAKLGKSLDEYRRDIGELFEPFTKIAAANPHAAAPKHRSAAELATITERNRIVAEGAKHPP